MSGVWRAVMSCPASVMRPWLACHRPMMVRSVVVLPAPLRPSSMVSSPLGTVQIHAVQDVVRPDVRVHLFQFQQHLAHAASISSGLMPR
jgi:hypothetical protein